MSSLFLDKKSPIEKNYSGDLPHWFQAEKIQFVTFRLADSMPKAKIEEIKDIEKRFLLAHPKPWHKATYDRFRKGMGNINEECLDKGYGACWLRNPMVRTILVPILHHGDNIQYCLHSYVVMPNHLHLLIQPFDEYTIEELVGAMKSISARKINSYLQRTGKLWQRECWDRIVRNPANLSQYIEYIRQNPQHLREDEYTYYLSPLYK